MGISRRSKKGAPPTQKPKPPSQETRSSDGRNVSPNHPYAIAFSPPRATTTTAPRRTEEAHAAPRRDGVEVELELLGGARTARRPAPRSHPYPAATTHDRVMMASWSCDGGEEVRRSWNTSTSVSFASRGSFPGAQSWRDGDPRARARRREGP